MGEEQKVGYEELLAASRRPSRASTDFTLAVEEEFALLDPATLELVNRFEEVQAGGEGHRARAASRRRADRVRGRDPHRPLRDVRGGAPSSIGERRAQLRALVDGARRRPLRRRHASVEPLAGPAHHRHAALPPERRAACATSSGATTRSACTCTSASTAPTARSSVTQRAAQLPARAARAVGELAVRRGRVHVPALRAHADLHAHVPALRHPGLRSRAGTTGSPTSASSTRPARSPSTRRCGGASAPHLVFPTVEIRICDAQPDLAESRSLAALMLLAHGAHRARARRGRAAARRGRTGCSRRTSGARSAGASRAS